jgi:hypothetical protein
VGDGARANGLAVRFQPGGDEVGGGGPAVGEDIVARSLDAVDVGFGDVGRESGQVVVGRVVGSDQEDREAALRERRPDRRGKGPRDSIFDRGNDFRRAAGNEPAAFGSPGGSVRLLDRRAPAPKSCPDAFEGDVP